MTTEIRPPRAVVMVLDSVGVGELPDAGDYGDTGSNTLGNTARAVGGLDTPHLGAMGLGNIIDVEGVPRVLSPTACWGRCLEISPGKDTTTGHWEMMGVVLSEPFPTYPEGFPDEVMQEFTRLSGTGYLGNYAASGTEIIQVLGDEHVATGDPIVYTSADSVFQIAAHEDVIPVDALYELCRISREMLSPPHAVGRVIARPFVGGSGAYVRTDRRRDFALEAFEDTALDILQKAGVPVRGVGKIGDIFAWRGVDDSPHVHDNMDAFDMLVERVGSDEPGFVFANLVDFDMLWGHRNDVEAYARGLEAVDRRMPELLSAMRDGDLLIVTADHGCDPTTSSTDHSREHAPVLACVKGAGIGVDLGVRETFGDVGETVLDFYGLGGTCLRGTSFLDQVRGS
jgi:phosphopentomutase